MFEYLHKEGQYNSTFQLIKDIKPNFSTMQHFNFKGQYTLLINLLKGIKLKFRKQLNISALLINLIKGIKPNFQYNATFRLYLDQDKFSSLTLNWANVTMTFLNAVCQYVIVKLFLKLQFIMLHAFELKCTKNQLFCYIYFFLSFFFILFYPLPYNWRSHIIICIFIKMHER